jgi:transcriptional regulator with XRE-family HTH domain
LAQPELPLWQQGGLARCHFNKSTPESGVEAPKKEASTSRRDRWRTAALRLAPRLWKEATMEGTGLEWRLLLAVARTLRDWTQEQLAMESGVAKSTIARQEVGGASSSAVEEQLLKTLGILERLDELRLLLGQLRETMLDPNRRHAIRGIEPAGEAAAQLTRAALGLELDRLRRAGKESAQDAPRFLEGLLEGHPLQGVALEWGHLLAVLRTLRGWNQEELGAAAGVSVAAISKAELGIQVPVEEVREKLETALGVRGVTRELRILLGEVRAGMLDPERGQRGKAIREAGEVASKMTTVALDAVLEDLRRIGRGKDPAPDGSGEASGTRAVSAPRSGS